MPTGKYSFYLHADDRTDRLVAMTLESVSKPYRGEFLRTVVTAGAVLSSIDTRLPGLLTEVFDGHLQADQLICLVAALSGQYDTLPGECAERDAVLPVTNSVTAESTERRRFTVQLHDAPTSVHVVGVLESASTRMRGPLLRSFITAGSALHTLDVRFPRLLATLPVPPASYGELLHLLHQLTGDATAAENAVPGLRVPASVKPETVATVASNMKKLLEG